jgi:hypothetical protein
VYAVREKAALGDSTVPYSNCAPSRTKCSRNDTSVMPTWPQKRWSRRFQSAAATAISRKLRPPSTGWKILPVDFRWAASDIAVLWLRALLSQSRGEKAADRPMATSLGFEGQGTWADAEAGRGGSRRRSPESLKTLPRVVGADRRQFHRVACFDHDPVPDDHRDVAVPHGEIARP